MMCDCNLVNEWYEDICLECCRTKIKADPKTCILSDLIREIKEEGG